MKGHLLVNEETAPIVKMIFELCAKGIGPTNIANMLREKRILKPTAYRYDTAGVYGTVTDTTQPYGWNGRTVAGILANEVYLGHTINCATTVVSYKDKRKKKRPESEWYRFETTHEAIIDKTTWELAQAVRQGKRRRTAMGGSTSIAVCYTVPIAIQSCTSSEKQHSKQMPTDLFAADTELHQSEGA